MDNKITFKELKVKLCEDIYGIILEYINPLTLVDRVIVGEIPDLGIKKWYQLYLNYHDKKDSEKEWGYFENRLYDSINYNFKSVVRSFDDKYKRFYLDNDKFLMFLVFKLIYRIKPDKKTEEEMKKSRKEENKKLRQLILTTLQNNMKNNTFFLFDLLMCSEDGKCCHYDKSGLWKGLRCGKISEYFYCNKHIGRRLWGILPVTFIKEISKYLIKKEKNNITIKYPMIVDQIKSLYSKDVLDILLDFNSL